MDTEAAQAGPSVTNDEGKQELVFDAILLVGLIFDAAWQFAQLPIGQMFLSLYFPNSPTTQHFIETVLAQAKQVLDHSHPKPIVFHLHNNYRPKAPWVCFLQGHDPQGSVYPPRKHVFLRPSLFSTDVGPSITQKLSDGANWTSLIGREFIVALAVLMSRLLDDSHGNPTLIEPDLPPNYFAIKNPAWTDAKNCAHYGLDPTSFDRNAAYRIVGLQLCREATKDPALQRSTFSNVQNFIWFSFHVWALLHGFDMDENGILKPCNLVDMNPQVKAIKESKEQKIRDYMI